MCSGPVRKKDQSEGAIPGDEVVPTGGAVGHNTVLYGQRLLVVDAAGGRSVVREGVLRVTVSVP